MRKGSKLNQETKDKISKANIGRKHTPEAKAKISAANKGKILSPETKEKISIANIGRLGSNKGKKFTPEHRAKISKANKGRVISPETRLKISATNKGRILSPETCAKMSASTRGEKHPNYGKHLSPETCAKLSIIMRERLKNPEDHPNWLGGLSFEPYCPKWTPDLRRRVRAYFNHECLLCGKSTKENGEQLCCHHVSYNKMACCDGKPVQFAALCRSCHSRTGGQIKNRARWEALIHVIINEIYNNRSYFTKEEWKNLTKAQLHLPLLG
jgi:hypothetical protein